MTKQHLAVNARLVFCRNKDRVAVMGTERCEHGRPEGAALLHLSVIQLQNRVPHGGHDLSLRPKSGSAASWVSTVGFASVTATCACVLAGLEAQAVGLAMAVGEGRDGDGGTGQPRARDALAAGGGNV
jgi:hypothetical protein